MGELDAAHVERRRIGRHLVRVVDEYELRLRIDEAADQPGAGLDDFVGEPLELLTVARVERERGQAVENLRRTEAAQLPPQSDPRRRRLTREPVAQQHPGGPARRHTPIITEVCNTGCRPPSTPHYKS